MREGRKASLTLLVPMSAFDPKRTCAPHQSGHSTDSAIGLPTGNDPGVSRCEPQSVVGQP